MAVVGQRMHVNYGTCVWVFLHSDSIVLLYGVDGVDTDGRVADQDFFRAGTSERGRFGFELSFYGGQVFCLICHDGIRSGGQDVRNSSRCSIL